ncbi:MAG: hypothetical protein AAGH78_15630 [Cyanobacteria bacterium P01_H01_bin.58]
MEDLWGCVVGEAMGDAGSIFWTGGSALLIEGCVPDATTGGTGELLDDWLSDRLEAIAKPTPPKIAQGSGKVEIENSV